MQNGTYMSDGLRLLRVRQSYLEDTGPFGELQVFVPNRYARVCPDASEDRSTWMDHVLNLAQALPM
jgi:hypothetical protein